jgi:hypothetical protein
LGSDEPLGDRLMFTFWKLLVVMVFAIVACVVLFWLVGALAGLAWILIKVGIVLMLVFFLVRFLLKKTK